MADGKAHGTTNSLGIKDKERHNVYASEELSCGQHEGFNSVSHLEWFYFTSICWNSIRIL